MRSLTRVRSCFKVTNLPVHRRAIALVLADLLRTLDDRLGFLRPRAVVGGQSPNPTYDVECFDNIQL